MIVAIQHSYGSFNLNANQIIDLVLETAAEDLLSLSFGEVIAWEIRLYRMLFLSIYELPYNITSSFSLPT
jgi:hypothetical protein